MKASIAKFFLLSSLIVMSLPASAKNIHVPFAPIPCTGKSEKTGKEVKFELRDVEADCNGSKFGFVLWVDGQPQYGHYFAGFTENGVRRREIINQSLETVFDFVTCNGSIPFNGNVQHGDVYAVKGQVCQSYDLSE